jgi:hypothetical protein
MINLFYDYLTTHTAGFNLKNSKKTPDAWRVDTKNPGNRGNDGLCSPAHPNQPAVAPARWPAAHLSTVLTNLE